MAWLRFQLALAAGGPIPGIPDWMGAYRFPVLCALGGAAAVVLVISIISVARRK